MWSGQLPAQHGVRLSCENSRIHHKSCVVHNECYSFSQSQPTAMSFFTAQVIDVDHIRGSLAQNLGVVVTSRGSQGTRYVSYVGMGKRNPGWTWAGGPG